MRKNLNSRAYIALGLIFVFFANSIGFLPSAQASDFYLPAPGVMVPLSPEFTPVVLKGIKLDSTDPFKFHFFVDSGDGNLSQEKLKQESARLIKYFLASLTIPEKDLWVNLSPYEKDRIIPPSFGQTEMGRDLLAEDYLLKQITASLIYPESQLGKEFWQKVYAQAQTKYGTTNIPVNTFNKVWIIPEKAVVYENGGVAFVLENHLKVMLEQDYLSLEKHTGIESGKIHAKDTSQLGSQIVREIVIPALTKEVNEGKNFSQLRQVFYSLILATWYKKKIKDSILNKVYSNQNKIQGLVIPAKAGIHYKNNVEYIYQQYLQAFKKGVYNYIKEEYDPSVHQNIPRKYFSGGVEAWEMNHAMTVVGLEKTDFAMGILKNLKMIDVGGDFRPIPLSADEAMNTGEPALIKYLDGGGKRISIATAVVHYKIPRDRAALLIREHGKFTRVGRKMSSRGDRLRRFLKRYEGKVVGFSTSDAVSITFLKINEVQAIFREFNIATENVQGAGIPRIEDLEKYWREDASSDSAMIITRRILPFHQISVDGDALVREGMQYAYKKTIEKYGKKFGWTKDNVYRKGACKFVVGFLNHWLSSQGVRTTVVTYIGYSLEDFHYVIFVRQGRDVLLIDPTWQQYLKREDVKGRLPKTLIARVESLRERLYAYGVKKGAVEIIYKGLIRRYYQYYTQDKIFYRRSMAQFNPVQLMANGERAMGNHAMKSERPVIYIVDDSLTMLSEWRRMIRDLQDDYHFLIFSSPQDALAHLAQAKPAFIITDTVMPGMDGPHFTLAARKLLKQQVPVLAVSEEMKSLSAWENVPRYNFITKSELRRKDHKIIDIVHKILPVNRRASARRSAHVAAASSNETDTVESYDDIAKGIVAALQTKKLWNDDPRRGGPEETKRRIKVLLQKMGYTSPFVINCLKIVELPSGIGYTIGLKLEVKIRLSGVMELGKILKGKAILIFDDNPISARAFKAVFESQGAYIKVVNRRGEFEELLDREGKGYDMFIVHMGYRGGKVDTSYLWDKVKKEYPDKKFLAVTGAILEPLVGGVEGLNLFPKQYVLYGNPLLVHNLLLDASSNGAMITHRDGGIDFDPAQMSMQVKGAEEDFKFDFNGTLINAAQVAGVTFTIHTMTPVRDLSLALELNK